METPKFFRFWGFLVLKNSAYFLYSFNFNSLVATQIL